VTLNGYGMFITAGTTKGWGVNTNLRIWGSHTLKIFYVATEIHVF